MIWEGNVANMKIVNCFWHVAKEMITFCNLFVQVILIFSILRVGECFHDSPV